jgi:hypothetical protein
VLLLYLALILIITINFPDGSQQPSEIKIIADLKGDYFIGALTSSLTPDPRMKILS